MMGNDFHNNVQKELFTVSDLVCEGNLHATTWLYNFTYTLQQSFTPATIFQQLQFQLKCVRREVLGLTFMTLLGHGNMTKIKLSAPKTLSQYNVTLILVVPLI